MAGFIWDESWAVGVAEIDEQHKRLFELAEALRKRCTDTCEADLLQRAVEEFTDYTRHHFATEERYMDEYEYAGRDDHVEEHMECSMRVVDFFGDCVAGGEEAAEEFLGYLAEWIEQHIKGTDVGLADYLNKRGKS